MGGGVGLENYSAVVAAVAVAEYVFLFVVLFLVGGTVSSRLGLRTEISARYCLEKTRTGVPHLFCFHGKGEQSDKLSIFRKYFLI